jgi:hypothetical protein
LRKDNYLDVPLEWRVKLEKLGHGESSPVLVRNVRKIEQGKNVHPHPAPMEQAKQEQIER